MKVKIIINLEIQMIGWMNNCSIYKTLNIHNSNLIVLLNLGIGHQGGDYRSRPLRIVVLLNLGIGYQGEGRAIDQDL